jgi:ABC-type Fe3+ transport system substrate-binding protein
MGARVFTFLLAIIVIVLPGPRVALAQRADEILQRLVEAARHEGQLDFMVVSSVGEKGARELTSAFKHRFGLDIQMNADLSGQESQKSNQAVLETKSGIPPTFDLMQGEPPVVVNLLGSGAIEPIENWEVLLAEIAPDAYKVKEKVSPRGMAGYGFVWATRISGLLYNPKLISERDLPKTWKEMGEPKYRGTFSLPPWTTITLMGLIKYDKEAWLEVVKSWGRSKPQILTYDAGIQRMMLGDLKFLEGNDYYYFEQKAEDPNAPIGLTYFRDLTPMREVMYVVRKGARHPNAAKLFAMWASSAEANSIFEKHSYTQNIALGSGPVTQQILKRLKTLNIKPVSWFENQQNLDKFLWLGTEEGRKYSQAIARAQREGK